LPLAEILLGFGQFHDVAGGILKVTSWRPPGSGIGLAKGRFQPVAAIRRIARRGVGEFDVGPGFVPPQPALRDRALDAGAVFGRTAAGGEKGPLTRSI